MYLPLGSRHGAVVAVYWKSKLSWFACSAYDSSIISCNQSNTLCTEVSYILYIYSAWHLDTAKRQVMSDRMAVCKVSVSDEWVIVDLLSICAAISNRLVCHT